jgi:hypothetical protein
MTVADGLITAKNLSDAWLKTLHAVSDAPGRKQFHVFTRIEQPLPEDAGIRDVAERLLAGRGLASVETVANTIFPAQMAANADGYEELVLRYRAAYSTIKRLSRGSARGTYFGRIVAHPASSGEYDQLGALIRKLRSERAHQAPKSARYEVSVAGTTTQERHPELTDSVDIYKAAKDNSIMAFPCLSFCSFQLGGNLLHMVAHYRGQRLIERGYGNYLGLARLQQYIATEAGLVAGQLSVVAGRADADAPKREIVEATAGLFER